MTAGRPGASRRSDARPVRRKGSASVRIAVAVVVVLLAAVSGTFSVHSYLLRSAALCTSTCHTRERGPRMPVGGHAGMACPSCHVVSLATGVELAAARWLGRAVPAHGGKAEDSCHRCHEAEGASSAWWSPSRWTAHAASRQAGEAFRDTAGHRVHAALATPVPCTGCHRTETHGGLEARASCTQCHPSVSVHRHTPLANPCVSCHNFAQPRPGAAGAAGVEAAASAKQGASDSPHARREAPGTVVACSSCHADVALAGRMQRSPPTGGDSPHAGAEIPRVGKDHMHASVDCKVCHNPHGLAGAVAPERVCGRCHRTQLVASGLAVPSGHTDCRACHPPHGVAGEAGKKCTECHDQAHRSPEPQRQPLALRHKGCDGCHATHVWSPDRAACARCHTDQAHAIAASVKGHHEACETCHTPHERPTSQTSASTPCGRCHAAEVARAAQSPAGHAACKTCHGPHSGNLASAKASCTACHPAPAHQFTTAGPSAHLELGCVGCHPSHGQARAEGDVCSRCHSAKAALAATAKPPPHRRCASCHRDHSFSSVEASAACVGCHRAVADTQATHRGPCQRCHDSHGKPGVPQARCIACHSSKTFGAKVIAIPVEARMAAEPVQPGSSPHPGAHAKPGVPEGTANHAACTSCHQGHEPAKAATGRCFVCHSSKARGTKAWPAESRHSQCGTCHAPHAKGQIRECSACHETEAASSHGDKHACIQCHVPHAPPPAPVAAPASAGVGASARAHAGGHAASPIANAGAAGALPLRGWWARCSTCHAKEVAAVASKGAAHGRCASCHPPHRSEASACTSCHADVPAKGEHVSHARMACGRCHEAHSSSPAVRDRCLTCHRDKKSHQPAYPRCQSCHLFE